MIIEAIVTNTSVINNLITIVIAVINRQEEPIADINFIDYIIKHKDLNYKVYAIITIIDSSFYNYSLYQFLLTKGATFKPEGVIVRFITIKYAVAVVIMELFIAVQLIIIIIIAG